MLVRKLRDWVVNKKRLVNRLEDVTRYTNKALGAVFLGLARVQLIRIFYQYE